MKYYLSGPMTGIPEHNYPMFELVTKELRAKRYDVVSPPEVGDALGGERFSHSYQTYIKANIVALLDCDAIIMLPGWNGSMGARLELSIAEVMNFQIWNLRLDGFRLWRYSNGKIIHLGKAKP